MTTRDRSFSEFNRTHPLRVTVAGDPIWDAYENAWRAEWEARAERSGWTREDVLSIVPRIAKLVVLLLVLGAGLAMWGAYAWLGTADEHIVNMAQGVLTEGSASAVREGLLTAITYGVLLTAGFIASLGSALDLVGLRRPRERMDDYMRRWSQRWWQHEAGVDLSEAAVRRRMIANGVQLDTHL